jgi:hypothetical protein
MRKLLLGSTAVAAAALFAPGGAHAQSLSSDAFSRSLGTAGASMRGLEVRVGGYFRAIYNYTSTNGDNSPAGANINGSGGNAVRLGKSDFSEEVELHILASGKAANGLLYGVAMEIEHDAYRQPQAVISGTTGNVTTSGAKNTLNFDEVWAYMAGPWGQLRYGDEDGAIGQLQSGHVTGFGTGSLDSGNTTQQVVGSNFRPTWNTVNDLGDNTKVIYLSPQFFGFDVGGSFAFNSNEGPLSGCDSLGNATLCDRVGGISGQSFRRRNEVQAAVRWRGSLGPVGAAVTVGYIGADSVKNMTGVSPQHLDAVWAGTALTAYGFTAGGWFTTGDFAPGFNTIAPSRPGAVVDDRNTTSWQASVLYNFEAFTIGGLVTQTISAGSTSIATGGRKDTGWSVGGNYRIAPGLDLFVEYNQIDRKERNFNFLTGATGSTAGAHVSIFQTGFRVAF